MKLRRILLGTACVVAFFVGGLYGGRYFNQVQRQVAPASVPAVGIATVAAHQESYTNHLVSMSGIYSDPTDFKSNLGLVTTSDGHSHYMLHVMLVDPAQHSQSATTYHQVYVVFPEGYTPKADTLPESSLLTVTGTVLSLEIPKPRNQQERAQLFMELLARGDAVYIAVNEPGADIRTTKLL